MAWSWQDPGAGSPAGIHEIAGARSDAASDARESRRRVSAAEDVGDEVWAGAAKAAFVSRASAVVPELTLLADGLREQGKVLAQYANDLEALRTNQAAIERDRWGNEAELEGLQTELSMASSDESLMLKDPVLYAGWERNRDDVQWRISQAEQRQAELSARWSRLVSEREDLDQRTVAALQSAEVLGSLWGFGGTGQAPAGRALLERLSDLSATDLAVLFQAHPELLEQHETVDPATVAEWWGALDDGQRTALLVSGAALLGALNGLPALVRVAANRRNAVTLLAQSKERLHSLETRREIRGRVPHGGRNEERLILEKEIAYLKQVVAGNVQLYLYDRDASRVIEMVGTPTTETTRVVTYVPGTFTSLFDFYKGGVQQISAYLNGKDSSTVAFVYKDGVFPGENQTSGDMNLLRIGEANDQGLGSQSGKTLASFEQSMRFDPMLGGREQIAIGHSWGLANITSSEVAGAHYDKVVSLSGAGMPPGWERDPSTQYSDFSYRDLLQTAQHLGVVWEGSNPREDPAFEHGGYYRGPDDEILDGIALDPTASVLDNSAHVLNATNAAPYEVLLNNHNLVATGLEQSSDNARMLRDLELWLNK
ncbi:hypothetical protein [Agromyces sp. Leaf222]|uniref:hypothetical protein n=1 Tax=Agromyces sp. Leaf222 TaxID=1735688 RepID=UPI00070146D6|nr:hypothetical protein [Agromyces sp. Leaf222]KQM82403.1 hypothetical protein ASE68_03145 [Agromyces sp. Leaf222]